MSRWQFFPLTMPDRLQHSMIAMDSVFALVLRGSGVSRPPEGVAAARPRKAQKISDASCMVHGSRNVSVLFVMKYPLKMGS